jgi:methylase of polypeptide subunit release factors
VLFAVDISSRAAQTTLKTLERNVAGQFNSVIQGDLLEGLRLDAIDVLVFNPPYVPTSEEDSWAGNLAHAWKGGGMGMETTWRALDSLKVHYPVVLNVEYPRKGRKILSRCGRAK